MNKRGLWLGLLLAWVGSVCAQPSTSAFYTAPDGVRIFYQVHQPAQPKDSVASVLLVHGFTGTGESWKSLPVFQALLDAGFKVVTLDLIGNGQSSKPHEPRYYQQEREALDVMGVASALGLKRYALVGYSRGSIIGTSVLVRDKRITRAVLGGMGLDFTNPQWPRRILFHQALAGKPTPELEGFMDWVKKSGFDQQAFALLQQFQPSTPVAKLQTIKTPILVIAGEQDKDNGDASDLAAVLAKGQLAQVPGDHNSAAKTPEFAAAIVAFLRAAK